MGMVAQAVRASIISIILWIDKLTLNLEKNQYFLDESSIPPPSLKLAAHWRPSWFHISEIINQVELREVGSVCNKKRTHFALFLRENPQGQTLIYNRYYSYSDHTGPHLYLQGKNSCHPDQTMKRIKLGVWSKAPAHKQRALSAPAHSILQTRFGLSEVVILENPI